MRKIDCVILSLLSCKELMGYFLSGKILLCNRDEGGN